MLIRHKVPKDRKPLPKEPRELSESEKNEEYIRNAYSKFDDNQLFDVNIYFISGTQIAFEHIDKDELFYLLVSKLNNECKGVIMFNDGGDVIDFTRVELIQVRLSSNGDNERK